MWQKSCSDFLHHIVTGHSRVPFENLHQSDHTTQLKNMSHLQLVESEEDELHYVYEFRSFSPMSPSTHQKCEKNNRGTQKGWNDLLTRAHLMEKALSPQLTQPEMLSTTPGGPGDDLKEDTDRGHGKYAVVSIMGPQSSGKSTILNKLFGCKFEEMDHTKGKKQVTTGIWMGSCKNSCVANIPFLFSFPSLKLSLFSK